MGFNKPQYGIPFQRRQLRLSGESAVRRYLILLGSFFTLSLTASIIRSNIGAVNESFSDEQEEGISAKSYVQNGLVALWDGIENVGYGVHNSNSATWVDLVGGRIATLTEHGYFSNDAFVCDGLGHAAVDGNRFLLESILHVEIVYYSESDGILATISGYADNGSIFIKKTGAYVSCNTVQSAGANLKNRVESPNLASASFSYQNLDCITAFVNGIQSAPVYKFDTCSTTKICFGGRNEYTDVPWKGCIYSIRVYDRNLTEEEVLYNYEIDKERFNIQ